MPGPIYKVGRLRLEAHERRLLDGGEPIVLLGKAFDTLVALAEGANALQTREHLLERIWPNVIVEPNSLQQNISLVRRALAAVPDVRIETVRGRGYRLIAEVREIEATEPVAANADLPPQHTYVCVSGDGARLAYARMGQGPALVKAASWLSQLDLDWGSPIWRHWLRLLSGGHSLVRYDARGNGLSDRQPPSLRYDDFVADLASVFDAARVERAPLLGISQGASVAVSYAARHPERVSALILIGGTARGWRVKNHPQLTERVEAVMTLMRQGWGSNHSAFRQIFTSSFFPAGTPEQIGWFDDLQRESTSPENAAALVSALGDLDVREEAKKIRVPTLIVHSRGDLVVPMKDGLELASHIAGARFVPLDSANHVLIESEPAWQRFTLEFRSFMREVNGT